MQHSGRRNYETAGSSAAVSHCLRGRLTAVRRIADGVGSFKSYPADKSEKDRIQQNLSIGMDRGEKTPQLNHTHVHSAGLVINLAPFVSGGYVQAGRRIDAVWDPTLPTMTEDNKDSNSRSKGKKIPEEELIEYLREFAQELGRAPRIRDMKTQGRYSDQTYYNRFGSWGTALQKAGLLEEFQPSKYDVGGTDDFGAAIDEMLRVAEIVDRPPTQNDMNQVGDFSDAYYKDWFGSWAESLRTCGLPPRYLGGVLHHPAEAKSDYGENWFRQRNRALARDRYQCQHCGDGYEDLSTKEHDTLHVHHIVPIREFPEPEIANHLLNLITLCPECHQIWERSILDDIDVDELVSELAERDEDSLYQP